MALVTSRQIRAARALLGWEQRDLATASGVSETTIRKMEKGQGSLPGRYETVQRLQRAFEAAGVVFLGEDGGGPGVRMREPTAA